MEKPAYKFPGLPPYLARASAQLGIDSVGARAALLAPVRQATNLLSQGAHHAKNGRPGPARGSLEHVAREHAVLVAAAMAVEAAMRDLAAYVDAIDPPPAPEAGPEAQATATVTGEDAPAAAGPEAGPPTSAGPDGPAPAGRRKAK